MIYTNEEKIETLEMLINYMVTDKHIKKEKAEKMVRNSTLRSKMEKLPDFIAHMDLYDMYEIVINN